MAAAAKLESGAKGEMEFDVIDRAIAKVKPIMERGYNERLSEREIAEVLVTLLFDITKELGPVSANNVLVDVRDREKIKKVGTYKYSGQANTMLNEGLIPKEVHDLLVELQNNPNDPRHIGPSYLRVKGLLTHQYIREFFGSQMAFALIDELRENPPSKDGYIVVIPNMTGGVYIGDETRRQLDDMVSDVDTINSRRLRVSPCTNYAREMRKEINAIDTGKRLIDFVEGPVPSPEATAVIVCGEELVTAAETTQNATVLYNSFGYDAAHGVKIIDTAVFYYGHPAGVERIRRLEQDGKASLVHLVGAKTFFDVAEEKGYITHEQRQIVADWLAEPWEWTKSVAPDLRALARAKAAPAPIAAK